MICFPNAKINLGLNIISKREDGFHNIETVFYPIPLSEILEITPNPDTSEIVLKITGLEVPGDHLNNLCLKAYNALKKLFDIPPVRLILHKAIPMGAGLGGGSSDGAFTLTLLNKYFDLKLTSDQLIEVASSLGSDCAFFINNIPALGVGKGNELSAIELSLKGYYLVLIKPDIHIGTAEAYAGITPDKPELTAGDLVKLPVYQWKDVLVNDFELSIFSKHPEIGNIKEQLYQMGAVYASMTGSGAAVYGIFDKEIEFQKSFQNQFTWGSWL
jgi:4-diphosphocytidyl-2-C-methyl-D-erythritol kinase